MKNYVVVGEKYHRWSVLKLLDKLDKEGKTMCLAECSCGTIREVSQNNLKSNKSKSCGCLAKEKNGDRVRTHGMSHHPLYKRWKAMVRRCHAPSDGRYEFYGGRGISVCEEWRKDPKNYIDWFESQSSDLSLTVDRIDNDGDYNPENCRLVTMTVQINNRRPRKDKLPDHTVREIRIMYKDGRSILEISRHLNVKVGTVRNVALKGYYKNVR